MKNRRLEFDELLCDILGSEYVYFQPPETVKMHYPAIVYSKEPPSVRHADDRVYFSQDRYQVVVITKDPDSHIPVRLSELPFASFNRSYSKDNLHHTVFTVYF